MSKNKYSGRLFPVQAGQLISIAGKSSSNSERFVVNLTSANGQGSEYGDIQLHMSIRFRPPEPVIVRNTHTKGVGYGPEERKGNLFPYNSLNPIKRGGDFRIDIFVDQAAYFITIDGKPFCTFVHRLPFAAIQAVSISQDVEAIYQVNQTTAQARPWPAVNPNTFEAFFPDQFNPGSVVVIKAIPRGSSNGDFSVNFYDGSNRERAHFHLRAFLNNGKILENSQDNKSRWGAEVSVFPQPFPFVLNQVFKLAIAIAENEFKVAANGRKITSLPFRDNQQRLLGSMTGICLIFSSEFSLEVQSVNYVKLFDNNSCIGFESYSKIGK